MMATIWEFIAAHWRSAVEILLLALFFYFVYRSLRRTSGARVLIGLGIVFLTLTLVVHLLHLQVLGWILRYVAVFFAFLLAVIFQPEIRRLFMKIGSHPLWGGANESRELIEDLSVAAYALSSKGIGALIAIERDISLAPWIETGVPVDALFSKDLTLTIFFPNTVLHDGALVLQEGRISAAACIFPLTQREDIDRTLGLRHRAAMGLTEECDAVAVVVSEETGQVSIAFKGKLERHLSEFAFRAALERILFNNPASSKETAGKADTSS